MVKLRTAIKLLLQIKRQKEQLLDYKNNYRKIVRSTRKNPIKRIKLNTRLVDLGFIEQVFMKNVMTQKRMMVQTNKHGEMPQKIIHAFRGSVQGHIQAISTLLAKHKKELSGELPPIFGTDRTNLYTPEEWAEWGDQIVRDYIWEHPIDEWAEWDLGIEEHRRIPLTRHDRIRLCMRSELYGELVGEASMSRHREA